MRYCTAPRRDSGLATLAPMSTPPTRRSPDSTPSSPPAVRAPACGRCRAPGHPKFLLDLTGSGRTLLQATVDRLLPLTGAGGVLVVTGARHAEAVAAQLPELGAADVLAEPSPRDSMAAIGLAAAVLLERHGEDVVLGSFAADHVIDGTEAFERTVREGVVAARAGYVVTIGIAATGPSTAFGYVRSGASLGLADAPSVRARRRVHREARRRDRDRVPGDRRVPLERRHVPRPGARAAGPPGRPSCRRSRPACRRSPPRGTARTARRCSTGSGRG